MTPVQKTEHAQRMLTHMENQMKSRAENKERLLKAVRLVNGDRDMFEEAMRRTGAVLTAESTEHLCALVSELERMQKGV